VRDEGPIERIGGTLEYMSREQAEVNQLDIDTQSDIYSLGVLLYELLADSPPFSRKGLEKAGMLEMLRVIREDEPSKPSTKPSTTEGLQTLAANRGTELAKLAELDGDTKSGVTASEAARFADMAIASLRDAITTGWNGWNAPDELKEPDFGALRGQAAFQRLVAAVEAKK
jgi:serine/threonine protein kinase